MTQYTMSADGVDGVEPGERFFDGPPSMDEVDDFGNELGADRVVVFGEGLVTLYVPSASGEWWPLCSGVDEATAEEMRVWDDLIRLMDQVEGSTGHPLLAELPPVAGTPVAAEEAVRLVATRIRRQGLDYPVAELVADRLADIGWSVYAPVDIAEDEDDIEAFLDLPVGRSAFLVSDLGRVKEITSSMPPTLAHLMFGAEEAFVRRPVGRDPLQAAFWDEFQRMSETHGKVADVTFVDDGLQDRAAALASGLITPIAQQLSLLGPRGWTRFEAWFSSTVSAETGRLRFWVGQDVHDAAVPEQMAVLVRRQRSLAALLPAGPWWRLLLLVDLSAPGNAGVITEYDYGDEPIPADQRLAPEDYRRDLAAYPRAEVPEWLTRYITEGTEAAASQKPVTDHASNQTSKPAPAPPAQPSAPAPAAPPPPAKPGPVLDTRHDMNRLYADDTQIVFGRHSLDLDAVRWVRYPVVQVATKRFMFPTTYDTYYHFGIGTDADSPKKLADIKFLRVFKNSSAPENWLFLVDLVQRRVEPRLLTEYADAIARGETVVIAGLTIWPTGISTSAFSLRWDEIGDTRVAGGRVQVFKKNTANPVFQATLNDRNAVLLPTLLGYLRR